MKIACLGDHCLTSGQTSLENQTAKASFAGIFYHSIALHWSACSAYKRAIKLSGIIVAEGLIDVEALSPDITTP
jgi:hypothetical protein